MQNYTYHDSDLIQEVYDYIFENDYSIGTNFCDDFPESWIDCDNAVIYLAKNNGNAMFKIKIEKVN